MIDDRIDRSKFSVVSFDQADADDLAFWLSKTPAERIEGVEYLRRQLYGADQVDARLQRFFAITRLGED
jgi:hypothetical protein